MVIIIIVNNCRIHKKNYAAHDYKQFKIHLESTRSVQATVNAKNWYSNKADLMKNLSLRNDQKIKKNSDKTNNFVVCNSKLHGSQHIIKQPGKQKKTIL